MDLALRPTSALSLESDIVVDATAGQYERDPKLYTATKLSLFCNARALPGDELPEGEGAFGENLGGWWGSAFLSDSGELGSRLWTLRRSAITQRTRQRARDFALEALAWMIELGIASETLVDVDVPSPEVLGIDVTIVRADGSSAEFAFLWRAI